MSVATWCTWTARGCASLLQNVDQWKLRVAWLELQLMFKQSLSSDLNALLDNVADATIEVFTSHTGKQHGARARDMGLPADGDKVCARDSC